MSAGETEDGIRSVQDLPLDICRVGLGGARELNRRSHQRFHSVILCQFQPPADSSPSTALPCARPAASVFAHRRSGQHYPIWRRLSSSILLTFARRSFPYIFSFYSLPREKYRAPQSHFLLSFHGAWTLHGLLPLVKWRPILSHRLLESRSTRAREIEEHPSDAGLGAWSGSVS